MKRIVIPAIAFGLLVSCSGNKATSAAGETTDSVPTDSILIKRLQALQTDGKFAFGHHDDPAYGFRWEYQADSSDVKNVTGDYPAIFDWDLGLIEWKAAKNLDDVPFAFIKEQAELHDSRGGINTFSWHPRNPVTGGNSWDVSGDVVAQVITEGTPYNDTIKAWIGQAADFIGSIRNAEGKRVPVVFRPWHEHTGEWFWWGKKNTTPEQYKALFKLTHDIFEEKGIDNVVWAYSPDKSNVTTYEDYMECYPGDEYVDIMGADVYHFNGAEGNEIFAEWMKNCLGAADRAAKEHGKVLALTESGSEALPLNNWYMDVLYPNIKDYPIAYVVVWRNSNTKPNHFYTPYKGHPAEKDFVDFYNLPQTVFLKDLK